MNEPWVTLTETDLLASMSASEREDFGTSDTDASVPDRVIPILVNLVAKIRGYIETWSSNTLSADPAKIPAAMVSDALALARYEVLTSIPGYSPNDARKLQYDNAVIYFRDVSKGTIRPAAAPDAKANAVPSEIPAGVEIVSSRPARTGWEKMNGL